MSSAFSLGAGLIFGAVLLALLMRRPWVVMVGFFLFFTFTTRVVSAIFIDVSGPLYAEQLDRDIGPGAFPLLSASFPSAPYLVLAVLVVMGALSYALRPSSPYWLQLRLGTTDAADVRRPWVNHVLFIATTLFTFGLYFDLLRRGVIPLFADMERYDYTTQYGGVLHHLLFEHGFVLATLLGTGFVRGKISVGRFDLRFLVLLAFLFGYGVLTGHRFSLFYTLSAFFLIPCGAYVLARRGLKIAGLDMAASTRSSWANRMVESRLFQLALVAAVLGTLVFTLNHSFFNVRDYGLDAGDKLTQRMLVQPSELWWITWERVLSDQLLGLHDAAQLLFVDPIDARRNTGIQMLMVNALGTSAAVDVLDQSAQYAGGYPDVLVEMLGPWAAWLGIVSLALLVAWVLRRLCVAVIKGQLLSVITLIYVFYALALHYIGGMLNFVLVWTFWAKLIALVAALFIDGALERYRMRLSKPFPHPNPSPRERGALSSSFNFPLPLGEGPRMRESLIDKGTF